MNIETSIIPCLMISVICVVLFMAVWRIESDYSLVLTPFLVLMVLEFVLIFPGFIYAAVVGISRDSYAILVFFVGFVSLLCGFICSSGYLGYRTSTPQIFQKKPIMIKSEDEIFVAIVCGSLLLVLAGFYVYQGLPMVTNALIGLLVGGDESEIAQQVTAGRLEMTKGYYLGGVYRGQGVISKLMRVGWPFLVSMAFIVYWRTKKIRWLCLVFILFFLSFVFIAGNGTRGPFVSTLIIYIILFSFIQKIRLRFVFISLFLIIAISILLGLYSAKMQFLIGQENFVAEALKGILERILVGNSINDVYAIEFMRAGIIKLRMGMVHFRDLLAVFPGVGGGLPFSNELAMLINPWGNATTFASGTYITKPYVDFGIAGVGVSFLFIGVLGGFSQVLIFKLINKDPFHLVVGAMLTYFMGFMIITTPMDIMSSLLMLVLYCIFLRSAMIIYHIIKSTVKPTTKYSNV